MERLEPRELLVLARASLAHHIEMAKSLESSRDRKAWAHHRAQAVIQAKQVRALVAACTECAPC